MAEAVGIDLGGTKVAAGLVDEQGKVRRRAVIPTRVSDASSLREAVRTLWGLLEPDAPLGIGVGAAGIVDFARGRYLYGPNLSLREVNVVEVLAAEFGLPVGLDNDANCAAWAEHRFGAGRGASHLLCVTLGTGIGGGFVLNGSPYRGMSGAAAEIGHILADPAGPVCGCGRKGCWEQFASGQALQRLARAGLDPEASAELWRLCGGEPAAVVGEMVTAAARSGDPFAATVLAEVAAWVGWGLGSLVNVFDPEVIAVGGGLARDWDLMEAVVAAAMRERVEAPDHRALPKLVRAAAGEDAGVIGAALLVLDPRP